LRREVFSLPGVAADLGHLGFSELGDLEALRVGGRRVFEPLFLQSGFPANSDFFPVIDQRAPRSRFKNESAEDLRRMRESLNPMLALLDGEARTPVARIRSAAPDHPVRIDQALTGAEAIGVFLSGASSQAATLTTEQRRTALVARALLDNCAGAESQWLDAMTEVARLSTPFLERQDVAVIFERAAASRCARSLDETGRERLRLLQAINERDAEAMSLVAGKLLASRAAPESERGLYAMAAITGHLARGRTDEARVIAERSFPALSPADRDSLAMRLLIGHAFERAKPRNP